MKRKKRDEEPRKKQEEEPSLLVQRCDCGREGCDTFVIAMIQPVLKPLESDNPEINGALACLLYFPVLNAQELVDRIRALCAERGTEIR